MNEIGADKRTREKRVRQHYDHCDNDSTVHNPQVNVVADHIRNRAPRQANHGIEHALTCKKVGRLSPGAFQSV